MLDLDALLVPLLASNTPTITTWHYYHKSILLRVCNLQDRTMGTPSWHVLRLVRRQDRTVEEGEQHVRARTGQFS